MRSDTSIELLVFSAGEILFGAYAGQVTAAARCEGLSVRPNDVCFSFEFKGERHQGIHFRHWLNQFTSRTDDQNERRHTSAARLLFLTSPDCGYRGVWVDRVEDFQIFSLDRLFTLPEFMQKIGHFSALWGIARYENSMILLLDLLKLL